MITNTVRGILTAALTTLPLFAITPAAHAADLLAPTPASFSPVAAAPAPVAAPALLTLSDAVGQLPVATEQREGYKRELYKHWNKGLNATDGCDTRREVILSEAVESPQVATGCKLTGGSWTSAYDGVTVTDAGGLDVDHMVPLAEVHDSGGFAWDATRREAYANDQDSPSRSSPSPPSPTGPNPTRTRRSSSRRRPTTGASTRPSGPPPSSVGLWLRMRPSSRRSRTWPPSARPPWSPTNPLRRRPGRHKQHPAV